MVYVDKSLGLFIEIDGRDAHIIENVISSGGVVVLAAEPKIGGYTEQVQVTLVPSNLPVRSQESMIEKSNLLEKLSVFSQDELRIVAKFLTLIS